MTNTDLLIFVAHVWGILVGVAAHKVYLWARRTRPRRERARANAEAVRKNALRFVCAECGEPYKECWMVKDSVWKEARMGRGYLHVRCLEKRLGRPLVLEDFTTKPINVLLRLGWAMGCEQTVLGIRHEEAGEFAEEVIEKT